MEAPPGPKRLARTHYRTHILETQESPKMKAVVTALALLGFVAASTIPVVAEAATKSHSVSKKKSKKHVKKASKKTTKKRSAKPAAA